MRLTITIPTKADIVSGGFEIKIAHKGESWQKSQLGDHQNRKGVYIHHCNGKLIYIGKATSGKFGTFGERLRRECHETAASASPLFQLLKDQNHPVRTYFLDLVDLDMMVDPGPMTLAPERKALIMEQVLIGIFGPEGNNQ